MYDAEGFLEALVVSGVENIACSWNFLDAGDEVETVVSAFALEDKLRLFQRNIDRLWLWRANYRMKNNKERTWEAKLAKDGAEVPA